MFLILLKWAICEKTPLVKIKIELKTQIAVSYFTNNIGRGQLSKGF